MYSSYPCYPINIPLSFMYTPLILAHLCIVLILVINIPLSFMYSSYPCYPINIPLSFMYSSYPCYPINIPLSFMYSSLLINIPLIYV